MGEPALSDGVIKLPDEAVCRRRWFTWGRARSSTGDEGQRARARRTSLRVRAAQVALLAAWLALWQFLPDIRALSHASLVFDRRFISSPTSTFSEVINLLTGRRSSVTIWPYLRPTLEATFVGTGIGVVAGALAGLVLSGMRFWSPVLRPFFVALNAVPRIALIPVLVLLLGPTIDAGIAISVSVVFFVAFFAAFEGGSSVSPELLENCAVLGASKLQTTRTVRLPYVMAWTLASLPLAVTYGLLSVITGEILTGYGGIGQLVNLAEISANATRTYALVVILGVLGVTILGLADLGKRPLLHWWGK